MKYYIAAGMYYDRYNNKYEFRMVRSAKKPPYITTDPNGVPHTKHHSSVYELSEDFNEVYLVKDHGTVRSPKRVKLHLSDVLKLLEAKKKYDENLA